VAKYNQGYYKEALEDMLRCKEIDTAIFGENNLNNARTKNMIDKIEAKMAEEDNK
jgi:hypothetical protein